MGAARELAGSVGSYLDYGKPGAVKTATNASFAFWVYHHVVDRKQAHFNDGNLNLGNDPNFLPFFLDASQAPPFDETLQVYFRDDSNNTTNFRLQSFRLKQNQWQHLCVTLDGAANPTVETYINGSAEQGGTSPGPINMGNNARNYRFGQAFSVAPNQWPLDGRVAHLHVYERTLSQAEIREIMWHPGRITDSLTLYTPLWGLASPETDLSGRGNTATIVGTVTESFLGPPVTF